MSERKVKTEQGAIRFGQPVGATILADGTKEPAPNVVTIERLRSLQRQLKQAIKTGNLGLQSSLQQVLSAETRVFSRGKNPSEILSALYGPPE